MKIKFKNIIKENISQKLDKDAAITVFKLLYLGGPINASEYFFTDFIMKENHELYKIFGKCYDENIMKRLIELLNNPKLLNLFTEISEQSFSRNINPDECYSIATTDVDVFFGKAGEFIVKDYSSDDDYNYLSNLKYFENKSRSFSLFDYLFNYWYNFDPALYSDKFKLLYKGYMQWVSNGRPSSEDDKLNI